VRKSSKKFDPKFIHAENLDDVIFVCAKYLEKIRNLRNNFKKFLKIKKYIYKIYWQL